MFHLASLKAMRDKVRLQQIKSFRGSLSTFARFFFPRTTIYTGGLPLVAEKALRDTWRIFASYLRAGTRLR